MISQQFAGIDVCASGFMVVCLRSTMKDAKPRVEWTDNVPLSGLEGLVSRLKRVKRIAIDAPEDLSTGRHSRQTSLSRKFRNARCCEIAAGQELGVWVPFPTPKAMKSAGYWMQTGFKLWKLLKAKGHKPLETYPAGCFYLLNAKKWPPKKQSPEGLHWRAEKLCEYIERPTNIEAWGHDSLDAAIAALIAFWGEKCLVACHDTAGCDSSQLWLPRQR